MFDSAIIKEEYERSLDALDSDPFEGTNYISVKELLRAHFLIIDFFSSMNERITYGVKDHNLLYSTLGRQFAGYNSYRMWKQPCEICATLFYGIIKNHAFHDANKRTALLILIYHLLKQGRTIDTKQIEFEKLAVNIAADELDRYKNFNSSRYKKVENKEINFIADFIKSNTREIEKRYYPVTYQEFDKLLQRHGFYFEVAGGNYVNVVREETETRFFGLVNKVYKRKYIQVGLPSWKEKINARAVKEILKATGLTAENGIDSKAFFKDAEPLTALIDEYKHPLIRLKDR